MNREQLIEKVKDFLKDEEGLTMVEYAVAGGMIAAAGVTVFGLLGDQVNRIIDILVDALTGVGAP